MSSRPHGLKKSAVFGAPLSWQGWQHATHTHSRVPAAIHPAACLEQAHRLLGGKTPVTPAHFYTQKHTPTSGVSVTVGNAYNSG